MTKPVRILVADDHGVVREGLLAMLSTQPDFKVVGEARNGFEILTRVQELQPDVILMDLVMPRMDGLSVIEKILENDPGAHILVLTSFSDDRYIFTAIKAGALGYLLKDTPREQLYQAIRNVMQGKAVLHPAIALKVMQEIRNPADQPAAVEPLTPREIETLNLISQGLSNSDIAGEMVVDVRTVAKYVSSILRKLHLSNRTQAALHVLKEKRLL